LFNDDYERYMEYKLKPKQEKLTEDEKFDLLMRFGKVPKFSETFEGQNIGQLWDKMKQGRNKSLLERITDISYKDKYFDVRKVFNDDYERYMESKKEKLTEDEKFDLLMRFGRVPKFSETFEGTNIGQLWNDMKQGKNKSLLERVTDISYKDKYLELRQKFKDSYEEYLGRKSKKS